MMKTRETTQEHDEEVVRLSEVLRTRYGITTPSTRVSHLVRASEECMAAHAVDELSSLVAALRTELSQSPVVQDFLNRITINESYFFRDPRLMGALRTKILPELVRRRQRERTIRVWSAGCAAGQEAYSIAILLREILAGEDWRIEIVGTDIDSQALERAAAARYTENSLRSLGEASRKAYFKRSGAHEHTLRDAYRGGVSFRSDNLLEPLLRNERGRFDLILCRNVTIYFDDDGIRLAQEKVARYLAPDGLAVFGVLEYRPTAALRPVSGFPIGMPVYERRDDSCDEDTVPLRASRADLELPEFGAPPIRELPAESYLAKVTTAGSAGRVRGFERVPTAAPSTARSKATRVDPEALLVRARARADAGALNDALELLLSVIDELPCDPRAYYLAGVVQQETGQLEAAELMLRQTLYLDPEHSDASLRYWLVRQGLGDQRGADKAMAEARRLGAASGAYAARRTS